MRIEIGRVLARLPSRYREILLLRDVDGVNLNEIADALELSVPSVKSRLHRARVLVRAGGGLGVGDRRIVETGAK